MDNIRTAGVFDRNLLHYTAVAGDLAECRSFLQHNNSAVNLPDSMGRTALILAVFFKKYSIVKTLLNFGASAYIADKYGLTAIHYCLFTDDASMLQLLIGSNDQDKEFQEFIEEGYSNSFICPLTLSLILESDKCSRLLLKIWSAWDVTLSTATPPPLPKVDSNDEDYQHFKHLFEDLQNTALMLFCANRKEKDAEKGLIRTVEKAASEKITNFVKHMSRMMPKPDIEFAPYGKTAYGIYLDTNDGAFLILAQKGSSLPLRRSYPLKPSRDYLRTFNVSLYVGESTNMCDNILVTTVAIPLSQCESEHVTMLVTIEIMEHLGLSICIEIRGVVWGIDLPVKELDVLAQDVLSSRLKLSSKESVIKPVKAVK